ARCRAGACCHFSAGNWLAGTDRNGILAKATACCRRLGLLGTLTKFPPLFSLCEYWRTRRFCAFFSLSPLRVFTRRLFPSALPASRLRILPNDFLMNLSGLFKARSSIL